MKIDHSTPEGQIEHFVRVEYEDGSFSDFEYLAEGAQDAIEQYCNRTIEFEGDLHPINTHKDLTITMVKSWYARTTKGSRLATFGCVGTARHYDNNRKRI